MNIIVNKSMFPFSQLHYPTVVALCNSKNPKVAGAITGGLNYLIDRGIRLDLNYIPFSFRGKVNLVISLWFSRRYTLRQLFELWRIVNKLAFKLDAIISDSEYVNQLNAFCKEESDMAYR